MLLYPRSLIRKTVGQERFALALEGGRKFNQNLSLDEISSFQIEAFNKTWQQACTIPFYSWFAKENALPSRVSSLDQLSEWPLLTKKILRDNQDLVDATEGITGHYFTSGSTGARFGFPHGPSEFAARYSDLWSYRIGHGLRPFDPFILVSNTISGASVSRRRQLRTRTDRVVRDVLGNSWKTNGFIGKPEEADGAIKAIKTLRPKYLAGYTSAITMVARRAKQLGLHFPYLTHVIPTSESISDHDLKIIREGLSVTVVIEYGSVETGALAGTITQADGWPLKTTWWSNLMRTEDRSSAAVTTLTNRAFPLINYDMGDSVIPRTLAPGSSIIEIDSVLGRVTDYVDLARGDGTTDRVSAMELSCLIRDNPFVRSTQISIADDGEIDLLVVISHPDRLMVASALQQAIVRNRPEADVNRIRLRFIDEPIPGSRSKLGLMVPQHKIPPSTPSVNLGNLSTIESEDQ